MTNPRYQPYDEEAVWSWMQHMPDSFKRWLDQQYEDQVGALRNASDLRIIGLYQGRLEVLERILAIRKGPYVLEQRTVAAGTARQEA